LNFTNFTQTVVYLSQGHPFFNDKSDLIRGVAFLEVDNLLTFFYLGASAILPDKTGCLWREWSLTGEGEYRYSEAYFQWSLINETQILADSVFCVGIESCIEDNIYQNVAPNCLLLEFCQKFHFQAKHRNEDVDYLDYMNRHIHYSLIPWVYRAIFSAVHAIKS
jgi:hypothetical protein